METKKQYLQPQTIVVSRIPVLLTTVSNGDIPLNNIVAEDEEIPMPGGEIAPGDALSRRLRLWDDEGDL